MTESFAEYQWLTSKEAEPWLIQTFGRRESGQDFLKISKWLRKQFSARRSALIIELVQNRSRAIRKFENAENMFFTRVGLEMATDQWISHYKSGRFGRFKKIVDLCCSIGGDLIGLASAQPDGMVTGYDMDPLAVAYANANLRVHSLPNAQAIESSFESVVLDAEAVHVDPDRRRNGRSTRGSSFSPDLKSIFERLGNRDALGIKVAPATPVEVGLAANSEREWIGRRRECQQQMIWCNQLAENSGCLVATRLGKSGSVTSFALPQEEALARSVAIASAIQQYIYEPHSVLLAAGLADALASQLGMEKLSTDVCYYTSDSRIKNRLFSRFKVARSMKASLASVARAVQDYGFGDLEVKKRGITSVVADKYKKIRVNGIGRGTLLLCPFAGVLTAVIASRESAS